MILESAHLLYEGAMIALIVMEDELELSVQRGKV